MSETIVITGGAGFIGSHLAEHMVERGCRVRLIDNLSTGRRSNVAHLLGPRCSLEEVDVAELDADGGWLEGADALYHLAAAVGVKLIVEKPVESIEHNVVDTARVLRAAAKRSVPTLIASSSEVYGKSTAVPFREEDDAIYGATVYSRWSYALTKALDEQLALAHHARSGLAVVVVRLFNTVGPRQVGQYGMVLPRFVQKAVRDEPIEVYGDGEQTRCFCHVRDVVGAMPRLMATEQCHGGVFNLGADDEVTIKALAERVIALSGSRGGLRFVPYERAFAAPFDDPRRRAPDLRRIREAIGFQPSRSLDKIIEELIQLARHPADNAGADTSGPN